MLMEGLQIAIYIGFIVLIAAGAIIDYKRLYIPNRIIIMVLILGTANVAFNDNMSISQALLGLVGMGLTMLALYYISKGAIGMGDVKLLSSIGLFMGFWGAIAATLMAAILCGLASMALLTMGLVKRRNRIAFGPFIFAGSMLYILIEGIAPYLNQRLL